MNLYDLIQNCIPSDHASQVNASYFVTRYLSNNEIISSGQQSQLSVKQINYRMIMFCGHLVFYAKKR